MKYIGRKIPVELNSIWLMVSGLLFCNPFFGQNYHAINGSSYAGSLGSANNPASIVHVPYAWDITPFSGQVKQSTNAFSILNYSFFSFPKNVELEAHNGIKDRFVFATQDIRLLNTRINLHSRAAIAFGANFRSYSYGLSSQANYQDTMHSLAEFMKVNGDNLPLSGEFTGSGWGELYASYAQTILDFGDQLLNAGITMKYTRGLGGGYGRMQDVAYTSSNDENQPGYLLTRGSFQYAYSHNFDLVDAGKSTTANSKAFLENTYSSFGADLGFEYIMLSDEENSGEAGYAYNTKIGLSIMDIGSDSYQRGTRSRLAIAGLPGITDTLIEAKIMPVLSLDEFNDSLATMSESFSVLSGRFTVYRPTRLTINLDQHIYNNFFLNADLTIPLIPLAGKNTLYVKELNLLALTPRWEVQSMGAYLPVLYNSRQQLWVGAAVKMGPVLLGTHNLPGLFSKEKSQTGGVYLAITIRPGGTYSKDANAPGPKLSRKLKRSLECTKF